MTNLSALSAGTRAGEPDPRARPSERYRGRARGIALVMALGVIVGGCGRPAPEAGSTGSAVATIDLDLGPAETIAVGPGRGHPRVFVRANFFLGESVPTAPLRLADERVLEFIPLAQSPDESVELETRAVVDGEEHVLGSHRAVPLEAPTLEAGRGLSLLRARVAIDLSGFRDSEITLRWVTSEGAPDSVVGLGNVMLRRKEPPSARPDVLLICSDTHRFDHAVGGQASDLMPNLQGLAREGFAHGSAFSNASWTLPSVTSTLTGLYPRYHVTGEVGGMVDADTYDAASVPDGHFAFETGNQYRLLTAYPSALRTLPEYLRDLGYSTAIVAANPLYFLSGLAFDGHDIAVDTGVVKGDRVNSLALEVIESSEATKPLFLLVHFMDVHQWGPWYFDRLHPEASKVDAPAEVRLGYAQAVRDTDRFLRALLDAWERHRGLDNSFVAFFSDHGEHLLDDQDRKRLGHGNTMAEELLHVPLVVKLPGALDRPPAAGDASLVDLLPTIVDVAGGDVDGAFLSGRSMLAGELQASTGERTIFADYQLYGALKSSVRRGAGKLVLNLEDDGFSIAGSRLVRLDGPALHEGSGRRDSLLRAYLEYADEARRMTAGLDRSRVIDQEDAARRLRALGYIR